MVNGIVSLLGAGFWTKITDFFTGIFAVIPQFIYFFYTCIASVLDALQYVLRKLAGLDTYYINGVKTDGDILTRFINGVLGLDGSYSALNTVFWSMMIFGVILLILGVIISMIRAHYNYDGEKSQPSYIIRKALKNIATMAIVPIVTIFGVYLANIFLKTLDTITASSSVGTTEQVFATSEGSYKTIFMEQKDEWGQPTYASYDFFGSNAPTGNVTISGILFKAAANNCNRVRYGGYSAADGGASLDPSDGKWSDCGIFNSTLSSPEEQKEAVAYMIDYAFANNLRLNERKTASILKEESLTLVSSFKYLQSRVWYAGTIQFKSFSKYNVGLVWYYYNLWQFNVFLGFMGVIIAGILMLSIVFGLTVRLLECTALLICLGPVIGASPLEDGSAFKQWKKTFIGDVFMSYGAVLGMNITFLLLPHLQAITFFNSSMLNAIMQMLIIIVALIGVKQVVSLISGFVGGGDAVSTGSSVKSDVAGASKEGAQTAAAVASVAVKVAKLIPATKAAAEAIEKAKKKIQQTKKKVAKKLHLEKVQQAVSKARAKFNQKVFGMTETGDEEVVTEEEHEKLVAEEEENLNKEKGENNEAIEEAEGAKDRTSDENRAEAAELESEADSLEELTTEDDEGLTDDFEDYLNSHSSDFANYMKRHGKAGEPKDMNLINAAQESKRRMKEFEKKNGKKKNYKQMKADMIQKQVEEFKKFAAGSKSTNEEKILALRSQAQALRKAADAQDRNAEIDDRIAEMHSEGFVLEGKHIKRKAITSGIGKKMVQFSGETFKAMGSALGFDKVFKDLNENTSIIDSSKTILKDFAQQVSVQASQIADAKFLRTNKQQADAKKSEKQSKQTVTVGAQEEKDMYASVQKLAEELKNSKIIN